MKHLSRLFHLVAIALVAASTVPAEAKNKKLPPNARAAIKLFDATANVPVPSWQKSKNVAAESQVNRQLSKKVFLMEFVPKGQTLTNWRQLYAIRAEKNAKLSLSAAFKVQVSAYVKACGLKNLKRQILKSDKTRVLFALFCTSSPKGLKQFGYGPKTGEISVFWMARHKQTIVKIYHHWRGRNFDIKNQKSWPVSKGKVQKVIDSFAAITLK